MKVKYLNYQRAEALRKEFLDVVGKPFDKEHSDATVENILVAPYSTILQWQFLRDVQRGMDPINALSICKNGRFDVIVISNQLKHNKGGTVVKDLRSYLKERAEH